MPRSQVTFESKLEQVKEAIAEKPEGALKEIGKLAVLKIKQDTPVKTGALRKSCGYWYRKKEKDLEIGFKLWYAIPVVLGTHGSTANNFFMQSVIDMLPTIQELIQQALNELSKEED